MKSQLFLALVATAPLLAQAYDEISLVRVLEPNAQAREVVVSPDGSTAAINTVSGMQFWDLNSGNILELIDEDVRACAFSQQSPDGRLLVIGCRDNSLIFDFTTRKKIAEIETPRVHFAAFDRAQKRLATMVLDSWQPYPSSGHDAHFAVYDIEDIADPSWFGSLWSSIFGVDELDPDEEFSMPEPTGFERLSQVQFNAAQDGLIAADYHKVFYLSLDGEKREQHPRTMAKEVPYYCASQNYGVVDPVAIDGTVEELKSRYTGRETRSIYRSYPRCRFRSDMKEVVFAYGGQLSVWDITNNDERWHYAERLDAHYLDMTPDGSLIAIASDSRELALLDADGDTIAAGHIDESTMGRVKRRYRGCDDNSQRLSVSADGRTLLFNECAVFVLRRQ